MKEHYFFSQPHQPFFLLAFINAIVAMVLFMLSFKGSILLTLSPSTFHAYSLIYLLFTPAFLAFVFTTFPRFSSTPSIQNSLYLKVFSLFAIGSLLVIFGSIFSSTLNILGMLVTLGGHLWAIIILEEIYSSSEIEDKHDIFWILLTMIFGFLSHLLFVTGHIFWQPIQDLAVQIAIYLYLFMLAFSVAQRMVPFFSHCIIEKNIYLLKALTTFLILHILLETIYPHLSFIIDAIIALILGRELLRWNLPFPNPNPLLWILHVALIWIPIAFSFAAISNLISLIDGTSFLFLDIHILVLGFVFTILIGFGTRVTLGHSGNQMLADNWIKILFNMTQLVVISRLITSMTMAWGWNFIIFFDISVTLWVITFVFWILKFFKVLIFGKKLN